MLATCKHRWPHDRPAGCSLIHLTKQRRLNAKGVAIGPRREGARLALDFHPIQHLGSVRRRLLPWLAPRANRTTATTRPCVDCHDAIGLPASQRVLLRPRRHYRARRPARDRPWFHHQERKELGAIIGVRYRSLSK